MTILQSSVKMPHSALNNISAHPQDQAKLWPLIVAGECIVHLLLAVSGGFLLIRRVQGAFNSPVSFGMLLVIGVVLAGWLAASYWRSRILQVGTISLSLGVLAAILIALAISIPGSSVIGVVLLWVPILTTAFFFCWAQISDLRGETEQRPSKQPQPTVSDVFEEAIDPSISQSITRRFDQDGTEVISGSIRCRFEPNERMRNAHIGFCPVLESEPEVFAEIVEGPDAEVGVGQILCTGVRFDVKIQHPGTEKTSVLIEFYAKCPVSGHSVT